MKNITTSARRWKAPQSLRLADFRRVQGVLADVDGTLTSENLLKSTTVRALERLREADLKVVLVTGRPSAWGECWLRILPVDGVIAENGGLYFVRHAGGQLRKVYAQSSTTRARSRSRLLREVRAALKRVPGAAFSTDSSHTEVDIAIDYNEQVKLNAESVRSLEVFLRRRGVSVALSSVHLNCWIGSFDKLWMVRRFIRNEWGLDVRNHDRRFVYVGDSFNDAPMFKAFSLAVGVANVWDVMERLDHPPAYVTGGREGRGFEELVGQILKQRRAA
jgi:HAD superfamily hydrolase (TIGR01484 family)